MGRSSVVTRIETALAEYRPSNSYRFGIGKFRRLPYPLRTRAMVLSTAVALKGLRR
jgi:hypothetical protein